jgi:hypothetical protein
VDEKRRLLSAPVSISGNRAVDAQFYHSIGFGNNEMGAKSIGPRILNRGGNNWNI